MAQRAATTTRVLPGPASRFLSSVANAVPVRQSTPDEARAAHERAAATVSWPTVDVAHVVDLQVPSPAGAVPVRVYHPRPGERLPAVLYCHGGGWVVGTLDTYDSLCRQLARRCDAVVVSVDYRLAPEHPFPAPLDDVDAALDWTLARAAQLEIDRDAVAVAGDSAGGYLAAHAAQRAAKRGIELSAQVLIYPIVDPALATPSASEFAEGYYLTTEDMRWYWAQHLGAADPAEASVASPTPVEGTCPAIVLTAGLDPLRDEGAALAEHLAAAGIEAELHVFHDMIHGFVRFGAVFDRAGQALDVVALGLARRWPTRQRT